MDFLIHHLLRSSADRFPQKEALVHGDPRLTYAETARQVGGLAHGLQHSGVQRGDRIGIFLRPSLPQALSIFGVSQAGGVFVPINDSLHPNQVAHILKDCGIKGLITDSSKLSNLAPILADISSLEFVVVLSSREEPPTYLPTYVFEELCAQSPPQPQPEAGNETDLAAILYTSGSTGQPKGVMLSHRNVIDAASIMSACLEITHDERILAILPFSFDAGLNQLTTAFQKGATLVLMTFVFAKQIVRMMLKERISGMTGVPTLWSLLAQANTKMQESRFPCLRYISNTGGVLPQPVLTTLREGLPTTKIYIRYGQTETFLSTYLPPEELDRHPTSIGKAVPDTELLVINDRGQLCQPGEVGELVHRGPIMSQGYWGQPELTEQVFRPHPFLASELCGYEKVCYSGDLVKMDEDGFFYFIGRRDTLIKSSGFRISPTEVEDVLFQSGKLQGAAVIGVPDEMLGQHIKAFVVPRNGDSVDQKQLISFCGERMPRHMVPKSVKIVEDLPQTGSGKVDYPALRRFAGVMP